MARRTLASFALASILVAGPALAEDLTVVSKTTVGGKSTTSTQYMSASKVRTGDGDNESIMDMQSGQFTVIDHKKKEYWQSTQAEFDAAMARLETQLASMPGPLKKMMGGGDAEVVVTKGTNPRQIAGKDTEHWVVTVGDGLRWELWAAPSVQAPMHYYDAMKTRFAAAGPFARRYVKLFEGMKKINGFPLATNVDVKMGPVKSQSATEATEVRVGAIPASTFDIPAGFKKVDSPLTKMGK